MARVGVLFQIGSLGDSIVSLPALRSLRELLTDCDEYILVDRFDHASKVLPLDVFEMVVKPRERLSYRGAEAGSRLSRVGSIASLSMRLRYYRPHYGIYLMPSDRTARQIARDRAFCRLAGISELVGFQEISHTAEKVCPGRKCSEAYLRLRRLWNDESDERFAFHGRTPLFEPSRAAEDQVDGWLEQKRRFPAKPLVALCPFSNCSSKDLSVTAAVALMKKMEDEADCEVIVIGGVKDHPVGASIVALSGAGLNGCGSFSVSETAALLRKCGLAITVDSGPMHLAAAVGTSTVVIFSRTNPHLDRWFPLGTGHTILYREIGCAGCGERACPLADHPCIDGLSVEEIAGAALHRLHASPLPEMRAPNKLLML
jgi:heptosyltransferase-3